MPASAPFAFQQARLFQDTQVPGDGGQRHAKGLGQGGDPAFPLPGEALQDAPPRGVSQRREGPVQALGITLYNFHVSI